MEILKNFLKRVIVIEGFCSSGKTSAAINIINIRVLACFQYHILFVTPSLSEIQRIIIGCPNAHFKEPSDKFGTKEQDLIDLILRGENIVTTHALFNLLTLDDRIRLALSGYVLIMDEAPDVLVDDKQSKDDKDVANAKSDCVEVSVLNDEEVENFYKENNETSNKKPPRIRVSSMRWNGEENYGTNSQNRALVEHKKSCDNGSAYKIEAGDNKYTIIKMINPEKFQVFAATYIMTYLFREQIVRAYFDFFEIPYAMWHVYQDENGEYKFAEGEKLVLGSTFAPYIKLWEPSKKYNITQGRGFLSKRWALDRLDKEVSYEDVEELKKSCTNFVRNFGKAKGDDIIWTTFSKAQKLLSGDGYARQFVPLNAKATNQYQDRHYVIYLANRFNNPYIKALFASKGIKFSDNGNALQELIQFIFRSAIRKKEIIYLYLPSKRERKLLEIWMNDSLNFNIRMKNDGEYMLVNENEGDNLNV